MCPCGSAQLRELRAAVSTLHAAVGEREEHILLATSLGIEQGERLARREEEGAGASARERDVRARLDDRRGGKPANETKYRDKSLSPDTYLLDIDSEHNGLIEKTKARIQQVSGLKKIEIPAKGENARPRLTGTYAQIKGALEHIQETRKLGAPIPECRQRDSDAL
eukprot:gene51743-60006_t